MRITEGQLRRIIREELLSEAPLDDIVPVDLPGRKPSAGRRRPTIAHPATREDGIQSHADFTGIARALMKSTADRWVIIAFSDVGQWLSMTSSQKDTWIALEKLKYPGALLAIAEAEPMPGDYTTPKWAVIHDLLGHTLDRFWKEQIGKLVDLWLNPGEKYLSAWMTPEAEAALHGSLPQESSISDKPADYTADIMAAILLGHLTHAAADQILVDVIDDTKLSDLAADKLRECVDSMFRAVDEWLAHAREKGSVILAPF